MAGFYRMVSASGCRQRAGSGARHLASAGTRRQGPDVTRLRSGRCRFQRPEFRTIGQIAVIWLLAFVVGVGRFAHCIAGSGEILTAVLAGRVTAGAYSTGCCLAPWETLSAAL